ncbi:MAG: family 16 glycoside hydrolase [Planctomycetota bacterium]|jgi:glucose/arabinose dehydrogenase
MNASRSLSCIAILALASLAPPVQLTAQAPPTEDAYYTVEHYTPPDGVVLEVGGLGFFSDGRLAVSTRRGQVWIVENALADDPKGARFQLFAEGLDEGLGLAIVDDQVHVLQRGELTRLSDRDGDGRADVQETLANDWGVSGNYHEFAFGLPVDDDGNFHAALNVAFLSPKWWLGKSPVPYRGWALRLDPRTGETTPIACGLRSPCGLAFDLDGNLLATDNQGDWMPACPIVHVKPGRFFGHPASLDWTEEYRENGARASDTQPPSVERAPAAVWLPYKWSRSTGNLVADDTRGAFGPFEGQLFVAELTNGMVLRTQMEEVRGELQGAAFLFRQRIGSVCRVAFAPDGSLICGITNRGWGGLAPGHGLARVRWTGELPMEMHSVHLLQDGFEIAFTRPIAPDAVPAAEALELIQYDYDWWWEYGSPERHVTEVDVTSVALSPDGFVLTVRTDGLTPAMVARMRLDGVVAADGTPLLHDEFAYTINQLPEGPLTTEHVAKRVEPPPPRETADDGWLRLTYGDALDAWESEGWSLVHAQLDTEHPETFLVSEGNTALVNVGAGPASDYVSRYHFGDGKLHVEFMLPEGGRSTLWIAGRYGVVLADDTRGALPVEERTGALLLGGETPRPPAFDAYKGAGQWHDLDAVYQAPRLDAEGNVLEPARLHRLTIDDVLLHEAVELVEPAHGSPEDGTAALGPIVISGTSGPVALRVLRFLPPPPDPEESGWVPIFNGHDLDGWSVRSEPAAADADAAAGDADEDVEVTATLDNWRVEDGVLVGRGPTSHLYSPRGDYVDVELRATVRINDGGNSGMYVRARPVEPWPAGYEAQVNASFSDPQKSGSLYGFAPVHVELVPPGTWFEQRIAARETETGTHLTVKVNGIVVAEWTDPERRHPTGHIALQQHHQGSVVEYRAVEVRELPPAR